MKNMILFLAVFLLIVGNILGSETQSFEINGLKVIFKKNAANNIVSTGLYIRGGVTKMTEKTNGIEDFALQVAIKATKNFPKEELNAQLEKMDTRITAQSNSDYSVLAMQSVNENFEKSWEIYSDIILNASFEKGDVELVRERKLSAIKQKIDDPDSYLGELANRAFFIDHPYSLDADGTIENISTFSADILKKYFQKQMNTSKLLLVVVGNTSIEDLKEMVEETFESLPSGNFISDMPKLAGHKTPSIKVVERALPTNYIMGYCPAPAFGSDDGYAMALASSILRDRLFEEVRTKRNLSYAPSSGYRSNFSPNVLIYVTAVDADSTIRVMRREVEKISSKAISKKELKDKLNVFLTRYYLGEETNASQRNLLAKFELAGLGYGEVENILGKYKNVNPESILDVCKKYLHNYQFVLLGNPKSLDIKSFMF